MKKIRDFSYFDEVSQIEFTNNGEQIMSLYKGSLHIWDLTSGALILRNTSLPKIEHSLHSKLLLCGISEDK